MRRLEFPPPPTEINVDTNVSLCIYLRSVVCLCEKVSVVYVLN